MFKGNMARMETKAGLNGPVAFNNTKNRIRLGVHASAPTKTLPTVIDSTPNAEL